MHRDYMRLHARPAKIHVYLFFFSVSLWPFSRSFLCLSSRSRTYFRCFTDCFVLACGDPSHMNGQKNRRRGRRKSHIHTWGTRNVQFLENGRASVFWLLFFSSQCATVATAASAAAAVAVAHYIFDISQKVIQKFLDKFGIEIERMSTMRRKTGKKYCSSTFGKYSFPIDFLFLFAPVQKSERLHRNVIIHEVLSHSLYRELRRQLSVRFTWFFFFFGSYTSVWGDAADRYTHRAQGRTLMSFAAGRSFCRCVCATLSSTPHKHTPAHRHSHSRITRREHTLIHFIYFRVGNLLLVRFYISK